ncbi:MAG TPA: TatD family hydrolase [Puia sp.]|nr:TatD family hydrolase [Puia sp.]
MAFTDTHCHLYLEDFKDDIADTLNRAEAAGVSRFYMPAIDSRTLFSMLDLESRFPAKCWPMAGLHPCSVKENYQAELSLVREQIDQRAFAAVGEIGLDFYWDRSFDNQQIEAFEQQVDWAIEKDLAIVIHSRESMETCIEIVQKKQHGSLRGIFHCFTGSLENAKKIMDLGFFMGIGGVLTYKNSGLAETIKNVPMEFIVLETDSPYLTPVPYRGKRNESSYIAIIAKKLAEVKGIDITEIEKITTDNAQKIFRT